MDGVETGADEIEPTGEAVVGRLAVLAHRLLHLVAHQPKQVASIFETPRSHGHLDHQEDQQESEELSPKKTKKQITTINTTVFVLPTGFCYWNAILFIWRLVSILVDTFNERPNEFIVMVDDGLLKTSFL